MRLFIMTLRFLTRLSLPIYQDDILPNDTFAKGVVFFPWIGLIIGLISAAGMFAFSYAGYPFLGAAAVVLLEILVTGAFHLDGLADTCDALFSNRKREAMLDIMRDSRIGTNGTVGVVFSILCKVLILSYLSVSVYPIIILAPIVGKSATILLMRSEYAREEGGLGSMYLSPQYTPAMLLGLFAGYFIAMLVLGPRSILPLLIASVFAVVFRWYCQKKIGGMTGDTLGAGYELLCLVFLLTVLLQERSFV